MNKIYKVVWSRTKGCYIVASEFAKVVGKSKSIICHTAGKSVLSLFFLLGILPGVWATDNSTQLGDIKEVHDKAVAIGTNAYGAKNSIAIGIEANTMPAEMEYSNGSIVSKLSGEAVAVGGKTLAYEKSTAIGYRSTANGNGASAYGHGARASSANSIAIGKDSLVDWTLDEKGIASGSIDSGAIAIGNIAQIDAESSKAVVVGQNAKAIKALGGSTLGYDSQVYGTYGVAIGAGSRSGKYNTSNVEFTTAIGGLSLASGDKSIAVGARAHALSDRTIAMGHKAEAGAEEAIVIGSSSSEAAKSTVVGQHISVKKSANDSIVIGGNYDDTSTVVGGSKTIALGLGNVVNSYGKSVNEDNLNHDNIVVGNHNEVESQGESKDNPVFHNAVLGNNNIMSGQYSVGIGFNTTVNDVASIAIGSKSKALGSNTIAIGQQSTASSMGAISIGMGSNVMTDSTNGIAFGKDAVVDKNSSGGIAFGDSARVKGNGGLALGPYSFAYTDTGVALGQGAIAVRPSGSSIGYDPLTGNNANIGETNPTWKGTYGAVSLGGSAKRFVGLDENKKPVYETVTITRQITNVAAGEKDTDVVNVAQLKRVTLKTMADGSEVVNLNEGRVNLGTEKLNIAGGALGTATATKNIKTSLTSDPTKIQIDLVKDINLGSDGSLTIGNTIINNDGLVVNGGPSVTNVGIKAGDQQIQNVASGSDGVVDGKKTYHTDTNAANIGDVKDITAQKIEGATTEITNNLTAKGLNFAADSGDTVHRDLGSTLAIGGDGKNITTVADKTTGKITVGLRDDLTIGTPGKDGKDGTIGINGKDGASVVINGKDGSIGLTGPAGQDGTPGKTITIKGMDGSPGVDGQDGITRIIVDNREVATLDDGMVYTGDTGRAAIKLNKTVNITGGQTDETRLADDPNIGVVASQDGDNGTLTVKLAKDLTGLNSAKFGNAYIGIQTVIPEKVDGTKLAEEKGSFITGLDNTVWKPNEKGIVRDRAATEGQLQDIADSITNGSGENATGGFGLADQNGKEIKQDLGKTIAIKGGITEGAGGAGVADISNITTAIKDGALEVSLNKDVILGQEGSIEAGNTTINKVGVDTNKVTAGEIAIKDSDISISKDGIKAGDKQITNVGSGATGLGADNKPVYENNTNGANIGDVKNIAESIAGKAVEGVRAQSGKNITVKADNSVNLNDKVVMGNIDAKGNGKVTIDATGKGNITVGDNGQVKIDGSGNGTITIGNQNSINIGMQTVEATVMKDGVVKTNSESGNFIIGLENRVWNPDENGIVSGRAATEDQLKVVDDKISGGRIFAGDTGNTTVGLGESLSITGGVTDASKLTDNNIGVVADSKGLQVKLAKDLTGLTSITTGDITNNTVVNGNGLSISNGPTITRELVDVAGNKITNVADGVVAEGSKEAINGGQLFLRDQAINDIGNSISKIGNRIERVGAGAAALAALHPLDFDPDEKWDFAVGYGNYGGANAAAIGAYYRPNEDTMFSIGGSIGGGENMINAGISIKLGQGNHISTSRVAMAKEMKDLRQEVEQLRGALVEVAAGNKLDPTKTKLFPDVPKNHWAYEELAVLVGNGLVKGYPDGNFAGDRMMTRYEFAMIIYRQMQKGTEISDRLFSEFEPELERIRIDVVAKDKDGNPTIERVRVIPGRG